MTHVLICLTVAAAALVLAVLAWRVSRRHGVCHAAVALASLGLLVLAVLPVALPGPASRSSRRVVYLGPADDRAVQALARRYAEGQTLVIGSEAARSLVAEHFPGAAFSPIRVAIDPVDGVTVESALDDLRERYSALAADRVVLALPRTADLSAVRGRRDELMRRWPELRDVLEAVTHEQLKQPTPMLQVQMPFSESPDAAALPLQVLGQGLPMGGTVRLRRLSYRRGRGAGPDLLEEPLGADPIRPDVLSAAGVPLSLASSALSAQGQNLRPPAEGETITIEALAYSAAGEVIASGRGTTVARTPRIGVLVPREAQHQPGKLRQILRQLGLRWTSVSLDLTASDDKTIDFNAGVLQRWGLLLIEDRFEKVQADHLQEALRRASSRPSLMFVGTGGLSGGWKALLPQPIEPVADVRVVYCATDVSGSMDGPYRPGGMIRRQFAQRVIQQLTAGLDQRAGVVMTVRAGGGRCSVADFGKESAQWELEHQIADVEPRLKRGEGISDLVLIIDPDDLSDSRNDAVLPETTRKQVEYLVGSGVRLWLIAAGRKPNSADIKPIPEEAVIGWMDMHATEGQTLKAIQARLLEGGSRPGEEGLFPRLRVRPNSSALGRLPDAARAKQLEAFLTDPGRDGAHLRLIVPVAAYQTLPATPRPDERVLLWVNHWRKDGDFQQRVSPLLLADRANLGGRAGHLDVYQLALDLNSELAVTVHHRTRHRDALCGLLVRVTAACARTIEKPGIFWAMHGDGLIFHRCDHRPFQLEPAESALACGIVDGHLPPAGAFQPIRDLRRLDQLMLVPGRLDRQRPSAVRYAVRDQDPRVGSEEVTLAQTGNPPQWLRDPADLALIGGSPAAVTQDDLADSSLALPAWLMAPLLGALWLAFVVFFIRGL